MRLSTFLFRKNALHAKRPVGPEANDGPIAFDAPQTGTLVGPTGLETSQGADRRLDRLGHRTPP
ncbi:hypothetical protein HMPREF1155_0690 [Slackia sp. CM382]|nr:hypothetical protein HMPREF1155_0690 [Slackia sp. CM382]